ncbi:MAG: o-succinylbenzoate synthase [Planctomycetes bacterium]|nr:o-succinylbenzoate synthase [Planctomycetota bacterium]
MHIDAIDVFHVAMPLIRPWRTAYGDDATIESVLVCLHSGSLHAWGESTPFAAPCYSPEWAAGAFACVRDWLAPALVGQRIGSGDELQDRLKHFKGNSFAKGALDTAWWVLRSLELGKPLHRVLGATRDAVPVGADFGVLDSIDQLIAEVSGAVAASYPRIKLKFRRGWDLKMLSAVRRECPTATIHIDCNAGFTLDDLDLLCRIDDFALSMVEQPLAYDDLIDHARLQTMIRTPVCLDESINSLTRAEQAIDLGACKVINIKAGRVGGLTPAVKILNMAREAGLSCWVGGMLESAIGARISTALAMLDGFDYPGDIFPSAAFYHDELGTPPLALQHTPGQAPQVVASDVPGIGTEPVPELLERFCVSKARVEPRGT